MDTTSTTGNDVYERPTLEVLGTLADFTKNANQMFSDIPSGPTNNAFPRSS